MKPHILSLFSERCVLAFCAVLTLLIANGCKPAGEGPPATDNGGKKPVVAVSLLNLSSEFIAMIDQALEAKAKEMGVKLLVNDAQRSPEKQVQQVESFIAQKVDAIILNPCEVEASSPAVKKAIAAGIPIVNVNSETRETPTAFVGSRDEESAKIAMEYIAKRLNGQGNVLIMQGFLGQAAQIKRDQGAREVLAKNPGMKILAEQTADWDRARAMSLMENWIQAYGTNIHAVFAQNDEMGLGAMLALERAKMKPKVIVVSVDAISDAMASVKDGKLDATVYQDAKAQAGTALETVLKILRKEKFERESYVPFQLVTKENVEKFKR